MEQFGADELERVLAPLAAVGSPDAKAALERLRQAADRDAEARRMVEEARAEVARRGLGPEPFLARWVAAGADEAERHANTTGPEAAPQPEPEPDP